jgi:hypothetical protein
MITIDALLLPSAVSAKTSGAILDELSAGFAANDHAIMASRTPPKQSAKLTATRA